MLRFFDFHGVHIYPRKVFAMNCLIHVFFGFGKKLSLLDSKELNQLIFFQSTHLSYRSNPTRNKKNKRVRRDSNPRPAALETAALPTELHTLKEDHLKDGLL